MSKITYSPEFKACPKCGSYETGPLSATPAYWGCEICGYEWWPNMKNVRKRIEEYIKNQES